MKVFVKDEDFRNWDKLIQHCELLEDLTTYEKDEAKRAFEFLNGELGKDFLDEIHNRYHVLTPYILNFAPWTRKWIAFFADMLKEVKDFENYSSLLKRLKDNKQSEEALTVLEPAYKFSKEGFKIFFDTKIDFLKKSTIPDFKVVTEDGQEILFVEVSKHEESDRQKGALKTMERITEFLWRSVPSLHYCGRIYKSLAAKHLEDIAKKVEKTVEKVREYNSFQKLIIEDIIEIGIAHESDKEILQKWALERGLEVGKFSGPPIDVDEVQRIRVKVEKEQKQLPPNFPNIVIVTNTSLFFYAKDFRKLISELEEVVYKYSNLLAIIICGKHIGAGAGEDNVIIKDEHFFIKKTRTDFQVEQYIILINKYCDFKVSSDTISKIYNSFLKH